MNNHEQPNLEGPNPEIRSSLSGKGGHGSTREKRATVGEAFNKLKSIIAILPNNSKIRIGNQVSLIKENPRAAIEIIRNEIEAQREIIELLDNEISTEEALNMLDELLPPKEKVQ